MFQARHLIPAALPLLILSGCKKDEPVAQAPQPTPTPNRVSQSDIDKYKPNEAGAIMVVMYHRILASEADADLNRQPDTFRRDLEQLRAKGYYPVNALEMVTNAMKVPAGKTPVVLTFDDALVSQFHIIQGSDGKPHIDPDCAVGIMESFSKKYPDWPTKGTFFVLPKEGRNGEPFGQVESVGDKFAYLSQHGYEIANHTSTHSNLRGFDAAKLQWELATAHKDIKQLAPNAEMRTLALPYGKLPRDKAVRKYLQSGKDGDSSYQHKAVFLAAWRPILSPVTRADKKWTQGGQFAMFDRYELERVKPDTKQAKQPGTLEYWMAFFDRDKGARYVSDGNDNIVTVPITMKDAVEESRIRAQGKTLQVYGGSADGQNSGNKSGSLSVE